MFWSEKKTHNNRMQITWKAVRQTQDLRVPKTFVINNEFQRLRSSYLMHVRYMYKKV